MTLTSRDRKILLALVPLALLAAYWFLLLAPKRHEAASIQDQLTRAQSQRDTAMQRLAGLGAAQRDYASDYATVIKLGKAIPTTVDMPSLLVQLDRAARGTGIQFTSVDAGDRTDAGSSTATAGASTSTSSSSTSSSGSTSTGATTPADSTSQPGAGGSSPAGLDTVPLDFEFSGSFFDLADFFHRMKRFVHVANGRIVVRGRLMTIDSFTFETPTGAFPKLTATVHATVYLAPKKQGAAAGATPAGPTGTAPAPAGGAPQSTAASSSPTPAAAVTP